jgi:hypothetical protein
MKTKPAAKRLCHKVQFKSAKAAYQARDAAVAKGAVYDGVHAYLCPYCKTWHLGHKPDR